MIGPKEKNFECREGKKPKEDGGFDLTKLPNYLCYKASLRKERQIFQFICGLLAAVLIAVFIFSRLELSSLYDKLRLKEYILAPGVTSFTPASANMVTDSYVKSAAVDFLTDFGNISQTNVDEQFSRLKRFMDKRLRVKFELESAGIIRQIKEEELYQFIDIEQKTIKENSPGAYSVDAKVKAHIFSSNDFIGSQNQVVKMQMRLSPPQDGRRWFLEITDLSWRHEDIERVKDKITK